MADRSNLPAPYESPWRQLGLALRAVVASLGLELRALWRRNRAGELPRPPWWPPALAPLLWPLLLALLLALAAGLGTVMRQRPPQIPAIAGPEPAAELMPLPAAEKPEPAPKATEQTAASQPGTGTGSAPGPRPEPVPIPEPDPVLAALNQGLEPDAALIRRVQADPARAALLLELSPAFGDLDPRRQRRVAEDWLERSLELGFEQLELVDGQGQPLGYRARIGSGMILLNPEATS